MNDDVKLICFSVDSTPLFMKHCRWANLLSESSDFSKEAEINLLKKIKIAGRIFCVGKVFVCHLPVLNECVHFMRISDILISLVQLVRQQEQGQRGRMTYQTQQGLILDPVK